MAVPGDWNYTTNPTADRNTNAPTNLTLVLYWLKFAFLHSKWYFSICILHKNSYLIFKICNRGSLNNFLRGWTRAIVSVPNCSHRDKLCWRSGERHSVARGHNYQWERKYYKLGQEYESSKYQKQRSLISSRVSSMMHIQYKLKLFKLKKKVGDHKLMINLNICDGILAINPPWSYVQCKSTDWWTCESLV